MSANVNVNTPWTDDQKSGRRDDKPERSSRHRSSRRREADRPAGDVNVADTGAGNTAGNPVRNAIDKLADSIKPNKGNTTSFAPDAIPPVSRTLTFQEVIEKQPRGALPSGDDQVPLNRARSFDESSAVVETTMMPELDEAGQHKLNEVSTSIQEFIKMNGQHTTTLHETTAPAVIQQTHFKARHEVITDAVDREVHQVHYHTSVQPVHDVQELTQEHIHRVTDVQHSEVDHGDDEADRLRLLRDADNYKNSYKTADPKYFRTENPKVIGEHVHHHVYEIVRPVINREVRQLRVVHTTRPSREIIREQARHHNIKTLPALSITDFQRLSGDVLNQGDKEWTISGAPTTEHFGPSFIRGSKNGQGSAAPGAKALDRPSRDSSRSSSSSSSSRSSVSSRQSNRVAGTRDKFENMSRRNEATR